MAKPASPHSVPLTSESRSGQKRFAIAIAGEINLDLILYGLPANMPMERELLATAFTPTLGSSSAILAHNMAIMGVPVAFTTRVGEDDFGEVALARLRESGADLTHVLYSEQGTGTGVTVLLPHGRERHILTYPGTMSELSCDDLDVDYLASARHFHLSSLFLQTGLQAGLHDLLSDLKARGLTISLDTNDDPAGEWGGVLDEILPLVDILLPNEGELMRMTKTASLEAALKKMSAHVPLIAVKCGARGALIHEGGRTTSMPPLLVDAVDTIGAGDSFNAGFLAAYLEGQSPAVCAQAGNVTGALSTLRAGGTEAFRDVELRLHFLHDHWPVK